MHTHTYTHTSTLQHNEINTYAYKKRRLRASQRDNEKRICDNLHNSPYIKFKPRKKISQKANRRRKKKCR